MRFYITPFQSPHAIPVPSDLHDLSYQSYAFEQVLAENSMLTPVMASMADRPLLAGATFGDGLDSSDSPHKPSQTAATAIAKALLAPVPERQGTYTVVKEERQRVVSRESARMTSPGDVRGIGSWHHLQALLRKQVEARDTRYHGFYDEILRDYTRTESRKSSASEY